MTRGNYTTTSNGIMVPERPKDTKTPWHLHTTLLSRDADLQPFLTLCDECGAKVRAVLRIPLLNTYGDQVVEQWCVVYQSIAIVEMR